MTWIYHHILRVFLVSRSFHLGEETLFLTSAMTKQLSTVKQTSRNNSANSATLIVLGGAQMKNGNSRRTTLVMLSTRSEISQSTRRQAPTWLSPWRIWTDSLIPRSARVSDPAYEHI